MSWTIIPTRSSADRLDMGKPKIQDLTGRRFGRLSVLSQSVQKFRGRTQNVCLCRCDCGKEILVPACRLIRADGNEPSEPVKSCGCSRKIGNLSGQRFGRLVAVAVSGSSRYGVEWLCQCDCGKSRTVPASALTRGRATSCGCLHELAMSTIYERCGVEGNISSHTDAANQKRANAMFGPPWSDTRKDLASAFAERLTAAVVMVNGANTVSITATDPQRNGRNPYRGVYWSKNKRSWVAHCQVSGRKWKKAGFKTPEQAKAARDEMQAQMIEDADLQEAIDRRCKYLKSKHEED